MPFFRRSAVHPPSPLNGPAQFRHGSMPFLNGFHTAHGKAGVGRASSADHRGSLELDLAGKSQHIFEAGTHWLNDEAPARFREVEFMRRRVNRQQLWAGAPLDLHVAPESRRVYDLCASHCW